MVRLSEAPAVGVREAALSTNFTAAPAATVTVTVALETDPSATLTLVAPLL